MKLVRTIFKTISSVIFAFLMLIVIAIIIYVARISYLSSNGRINESKINFYTILTQSMWPNIKAGDIIVTYKTDNNVYEEGDIITFVSNDVANVGITITHRIDRVYFEDSKILYRTKGDNNNVADSKGVEPSNVIGKVVMKIPKAGYIQQFLVTKTGWIVAVVVPCFGVLVYDLVRMFKRMMKKKSKRPNIKDDIERTLNSKELHQILKNSVIVNTASIQNNSVVEDNRSDVVSNNDVDIYSSILINSGNQELQNKNPVTNMYEAILSSDVSTDNNVNNTTDAYDLDIDDANLPHPVDIDNIQSRQTISNDSNLSVGEILSTDDSDNSNIEIL